MNYLKNVEKAIEKEFQGDTILGELVKATILYDENDSRRQQIFDDIKESRAIFEQDVLSRMKFTLDSNGQTVPIKNNPNIPLWIQCITKDNDGTSGNETIQFDNRLNIGSSLERQLQVPDKLHDTEPEFQ